MTPELLPSRVSEVGRLQVRRALPQRTRRNVGAWCFADHMGPAPVTEEQGIDVGPHPHIGLQTVTWLVSGEVLHRDSLGTEQVVRAGQLNLMTAGHGVSHSEEATGRYRGDLHGIQLWIALPDETRDGAPRFEHHAELPQVDLGGGAEGKVVVGAFAGTHSPARHDSDLVGVELTLREGTTAVPVESTHEHGLVVLEGDVELGGAVVQPGCLAYVTTGADELAVRTTGSARAMLLGGVPLREPVLMWWNFVARSRDEIDAAATSWNADDGRFGAVASPLARIPAPERPW